MNDSKDHRSKVVSLFMILGSLFLCNALIAEFVGVKIFSLESSLGISNLGLNPSGSDVELQFTAGVIIWPIVFILTDVINEYFGVRGVKFLSYLTAGLISYAFLFVFLAIQLSPADWWVVSQADSGLDDMQLAFSKIFGQGLWIIVGSLVAFLIGQLLDAFVFKKIKAVFGNKRIWFRATVSTLVSQLIDSYVVLYIAFVIGANWSMEQLFTIGTVNYIYKVLIAILFIPLLYGFHALIDRYLGKEHATLLRQQALES